MLYPDMFDISVSLQHSFHMLTCMLNIVLMLMCMLKCWAFALPHSDSQQQQLPYVADSSCTASSYVAAGRHFGADSPAMNPVSNPARPIPLTQPRRDSEDLVLLLFGFLLIFGAVNLPFEAHLLLSYTRRLRDSGCEYNSLGGEGGGWAFSSAATVYTSRR